STSGTPPTFQIDVANQISAVPGVAAAIPQLLVGDLQVLDPNGKQLDDYGLTTFGAAWPRTSQAAPFLAVTGTAPLGDRQVALDGKHDLDTTFGGFSIVMALFAGLALFVGTFLIVNTFSMVVAQRSKELAMLRAIGASRAQVTRTILTEGVIIGFLGASLGL